MKIMVTWMTLKELDEADTIRKYKGRGGQSLVRKLNYQQPFGLHFHYRNQLDDHNK